MKKTITIILILASVALSVSGCGFFNHYEEISSEIESEYKLNQKIDLVGITYSIPDSFETMGKESGATILRHINTNEDNLLVGYLGEYDDSNMSMSDKHIELITLAKNAVKSSDGINADYHCTTVSDLVVVNYVYSTSDYDNISYIFFANKGAYCFSYSSKEPITDESAGLLESIVKTVKPSEKPITQTTTEKPTEKETEEPTTEMSDALHEMYSDNNITLSYYQMYDYKYNPDEKAIEFCVENKTDKTLEIQSELVSINGISYKGIMSDPISPNSKGVIDMHIEQKVPVDTPSSIGITINYFDGLLGDTINEHGIVIPEIEIK